MCWQTFLVVVTNNIVCFDVSEVAMDYTGNDKTRTQIKICHPSKKSNTELEKNVCTVITHTFFDILFERRFEI